MKKRVVIFGAGTAGRRIYDMTKDHADILCFVDNDPEKWGKNYKGCEILNPEILNDYETYDLVVIGTLIGLQDLQEQLEAMGVLPSKINKTYAEVSVSARVQFVERFSELAELNHIMGSVAEAGVFRGEYAKEINRVFPDRNCYLFDTFTGFDEKDIGLEKESSMVKEGSYMRSTSEELVLSRMPYPDKIIIKKGYFPDTAVGIEDSFAFVNLDMDLYQPTLSGLKFFYPKMEFGGVILIHDYFSEGYPNVKNAVAAFESELGVPLKKMPIGDDFSLAIIK